jgi:hypothetical protein
VLRLDILVFGAHPDDAELLPVERGPNGGPGIFDRAVDMTRANWELGNTRCGERFGEAAKILVSGS